VLPLVDTDYYVPNNANNTPSWLATRPIIFGVRACAYVWCRTTFEELERPWLAVSLSEHRGGLTSCHDGNCSENADGKNAKHSYS